MQIEKWEFPCQLGVGILSEEERRRRIFLEKAKRLPGSAWQMAWKVGKEDPRRAIYALKVGVSLTLVSLLFLMEPLLEGIGQNAIWAVMTVVLVLEFTTGLVSWDHFAFDRKFCRFNLLSFVEHALFSYYKKYCQYKIKTKKKKTQILLFGCFRGNFMQGTQQRIWDSASWITRLLHSVRRQQLESDFSCFFSAVAVFLIVN